MAQQLPNVFSIGWLVERYGVSPESIRNWERQGLIPQTSRTPGGHRRYNRAHVDALDSLFGFKPRADIANNVGASASAPLGAIGSTVADARRDEPSAARRPSDDVPIRSRF